VSKYLDGNAIANALVSGIHRVVGEQDYLNRINVFPVADGDTGTNMSLSMGSVLPLLTNPDDKHLGTLLAAIADGLLDSARGNSGAIVAQFFQGMSDSAEDLTRFTTYTFGKAVQIGSDYAHDALSEPRQGTILSVIAVFAEAIRQHTKNNRDSDFSTLMQAGVERAEQALVQTTEQLEVLRKAGVVDAGAKGFVALIAGMAEFVQYGTISPEPDLSVLNTDEFAADTAGSAEDPAYRFCTECIVTAVDIDRRKLREALAVLGDSLILAGTKRKAKIHVHVNDPENVFDVARRYGDVSAEKADDMHRQQHSSHHADQRFAVITDSAADIADEDIERLDIHIVPCRVQFGDRGYLDKVSITASEFFAELEQNPHHPTTSQPAPGEFRRQFQFLASHFPDVISINLAGRVSGTLEAARSAAGRTNAPGRVHVVNSRNASLGQGQLAVYAAECAQAGFTIEETLAGIDKLIPVTRTFALLNDLKYAVRGGRLPPWVKICADLLGLTPILRTTDDGRVATGSFLIGKRNRLDRFARHVVRKTRAAGPLNVAIAHAVCPADADELERHLRRALPDIQRLTRTEIGSALGVHGGPGTLIVATQPAELPSQPVYFGPDPDPWRNRQATPPSRRRPARSDPRLRCARY